MVINIADLQDPNDPQGRSYRQINAEKQHTIPIGALVETEDGVRLYVVYRGRDCDQTPLYWLSHDKDDTVQERDGWLNHGWVGGYPEASLSNIVIPTHEHLDEQTAVSVPPDRHPTAS